MVVSIQVTKFKLFHYQWRAISPNLMLGKVTVYTCTRVRLAPAHLNDKNCNYLCAALALQFLREKGVAHMDLKPQNLLLTRGAHVPVLKVGGWSVFQLFKYHMQ